MSINSINGFHFTRTQAKRPVRIRKPSQRVREDSPSPDVAKIKKVFKRIKKKEEERLPRQFRHCVAVAKGAQKVLIEKQFRSDDLKKPITLKDEEFSSYETDLATHGIRPNLAIREINDQIGRGVFLKEDAEVIPPNTFIGLYAGTFQISHVDEEISSSYLFTVIADLELSRQEIGLVGGSTADRNCYYLEVDGAEQGNFTRYLNHADEKDANLKVLYVRLPNGSIQIGFWTRKTIQPGDELLLCYGKAYWSSKGVEPLKYK